MLRSQRRGRDPPCWLSEKEPLVGKRRVNFQRCWLPVSRIGLHRRGVERVNCGPKLLDLGEKGVYSSYTYGGLGGVQRPRRRADCPAQFFRHPRRAQSAGAVFCPARRQDPVGFTAQSRTPEGLG